jgi:hypothetical protein
VRWRCRGGAKPPDASGREPGSASSNIRNRGLATGTLTLPSLTAARCGRLFHPELVEQSPPLGVVLVVPDSV